MSELTVRDKNIALAKYLGWESPESQRLPDFSMDANHLMQVLQRAVTVDGVSVEIHNRADGKVACNAVGYIGGAPKDYVMEALFTTLSLFVMLKSKGHE